jgi:hypothetical protein
MSLSIKKSNSSKTTNSHENASLSEINDLVRQLLDPTKQVKKKHIDFLNYWINNQSIDTDKLIEVFKQLPKESHRSYLSKLYTLLKYSISKIINPFTIKIGVCILVVYMDIFYISSAVYTQICLMMYFILYNGMSILDNTKVNPLTIGLLTIIKIVIIIYGSYHIMNQYQKGKMDSELYIKWVEEFSINSFEAIASNNIKRNIYHGISFIQPMSWIESAGIWSYNFFYKSVLYNLGIPIIEIIDLNTQSIAPHNTPFYNQCLPEHFTESQSYSIDIYKLPYVGYVFKKIIPFIKEMWRHISEYSGIIKSISDNLNLLMEWVLKIISILNGGSAKEAAETVIKDFDETIYQPIAASITNVAKKLWGIGQLGEWAAEKSGWGGIEGPQTQAERQLLEHNNWALETNNYNLGGGAKTNAQTKRRTKIERHKGRKVNRENELVKYHEDIMYEFRQIFKIKIIFDNAYTTNSKVLNSFKSNPDLKDNYELIELSDKLLDTTNILFDDIFSLYNRIISSNTPKKGGGLKKPSCNITNSKPDIKHILFMFQHFNGGELLECKTSQEILTKINKTMENYITEVKKIKKNNPIIPLSNSMPKMLRKLSLKNSSKGPINSSKRPRNSSKGPRNSSKRPSKKSSN